MKAEHMVIVTAIIAGLLVFELAWAYASWLLPVHP